ncbi:MAG: hypothetical protein ABL921_05965 [Pirellula sp.]
MNFSPISDFLCVAQGEQRVFYTWMRVEQMDQWLHWFVFACCLAAIVSYVVYWYRKDWAELPKGIGWTLLMLRLLAIIGIAIFFFDLQKRTEQKVTRSSKLAVLVDTSLSMTMPQSDDSDTAGNSVDSTVSRIAAVQELFGKSPLLKQLQARHDVNVYRFDQSSRPAPVATFAKPKEASQAGNSGEEQSVLWRWLSSTVWVGTVVASVGLLMMVVSLLARVYGDLRVFWPYVVLSSVLAVVAGFVLMATAIMRADQIPWTSLWSLSAPDLNRDIQAEKNLNGGNEQVPPEPNAVAWESQIAAVGAESRIGDAINSILEQERGSPLAGIVVFTDGRNNAGLDPTLTISEATLQGVPIHTVGMGTARNPLNVRVVDIEAPKRVFPGDRFRMTALLQASGLQGKQITVQLRRRPGGQKNASMAIEEERTVTLDNDDALSNLAFEIQPREIGSWIYEVKALPPEQDSNPIDNALESEVRVVEPKSTVLVIAGGPTREYQFVRNLLYRDNSVQSHVLLQTSGAGVSQEAKKVLTEFPRTRVEMSQYDCVIGFDADWSALDTEQVENLEKWISEQAGGLVIVAGPVSTPKWAGSIGNGNRKAEIIRNLAPLVMNTRGARLVSIGRFESETAWPIKFANDAWQTDFVQVGKTLDDSRQAWEKFRGVYSFYACYEPKPGATPLAYFSDPTASVGDKLPIYLATHFYGAGRVAFQGGGEFWRFREVGEGYFDTYYTKLVRWAGQGRLMRDSDRGILLLDKQQAIVGEQVMVRAVLRDAQFQPTILPDAQAKLVDPSGRSTPLVLAPIPDPSQPGVYIGQFFTKATGTYEVQLPVGGLADQALLTQQVTVRVPALEIQRPQRNDPVLSELASRTGGKFWLGSALSNLTTGGNTMSLLAKSIEARDQTNYLPGAPDREFQQRWMGILMALIVGCLSLEWLIRRLSKLA